MAKYKDFTLSQSDYDSTAEYTDNDALILAIRNILLSRPGNFPFNPSIGMDIEKYKFDLLDDQTISNIQAELNRQIAEYMPDLQNIRVSIKAITGDDGNTYLGILVSTTMNGSIVDANFLLKENDDNVKIYGGTRDVYNEIN